MACELSHSSCSIHCLLQLSLRHQPRGRGWDRMVSRAPSNPNHHTIPWADMPRAIQRCWTCHGHTLSSGIPEEKHHQEFIGETRGQSPPAVPGSQDKDDSALLAPRCLNLWHEQMQQNTLGCRSCSWEHLLILFQDIDGSAVGSGCESHGSSWAVVGYEQMDPWSFSVRPTQFTPSKGHMNKTQISLSFQLLWGSSFTLFLWTQMHIKSNLAKWILHYSTVRGELILGCQNSKFRSDQVGPAPLHVLVWSRVSGWTFSSGWTSTWIFGIQYLRPGISASFVTKPNHDYLFPSVLKLVFSINFPQINNNNNNKLFLCSLWLPALI